jgi:hypothetical protein
MCKAEQWAARVGPSVSVLVGQRSALPKAALSGLRAVRGRSIWVVTIVPTNYEGLAMLPHFIAHYHGLGVPYDHFVFVLNHNKEVFGRDLTALQDVKDYLSLGNFATRSGYLARCTEAKIAIRGAASRAGLSIWSSSGMEGGVNERMNGCWRTAGTRSALGNLRPGSTPAEWDPMYGCQIGSKYPMFMSNATGQHAGRMPVRS